MSRPDLDTYFMTLAQAAALRSTCDRKHVGCVLVQNDLVVAVGYNGSLPKAEHCDDVGHDMEDGHCVRTVHAEMNALARGMAQGMVYVDRAYINTYPCWNCFKALATASVRSVVYDAEYRVDPRVEAAARQQGIQLHALGKGPA
jgi:dCMP deaminase